MYCVSSDFVVSISAVDLLKCTSYVGNSIMLKLHVAEMYIGTKNLNFLLKLTRAPVLHYYA